MQPVHRCSAHQKYIPCFRSVYPGLTYFIKCTVKLSSSQGVWFTFTAEKESWKLTHYLVKVVSQSWRCIFGIQVLCKLSLVGQLLYLPRWTNTVTEYVWWPCKVAQCLCRPRPTCDQISHNFSVLRFCSYTTNLLVVRPLCASTTLEVLSLACI